MTTTALLDPGKPRRQRAGEPDRVSDLRDQRGTGMRDQARSVRRDFYGYGASITHHLQGETSKLGIRDLQQAKESLVSRTFPRPPVTQGARVVSERYCKMRVRVTRDDGRSFTLPTFVVRQGIFQLLPSYAIRAIPHLGGLLLLWTVFDDLWPIWDRESRALHDFPAHTHVLRVRNDS